MQSFLGGSSIILALINFGQKNMSGLTCVRIVLRLPQMLQTAGKIVALKSGLGQTQMRTAVVRLTVEDGTEKRFRLVQLATLHKQLGQKKAWSFVLYAGSESAAQMSDGRLRIRATHGQRLVIGPACIMWIELFGAGQADDGLGAKLMSQQHHAEPPPGPNRLRRAFHFRPRGLDGAPHFWIDTVRINGRQWRRRARPQLPRQCRCTPAEKQNHYQDGVAFHGRAVPSPLDKVMNLSTEPPSNCSREPSGQTTSIASMRSILPKPKCARGSLLHR